MRAVVLVVEDDPAVRRVMERFLVIGGYEVLQAESGPEALTFANALGVQPVVLVVDIVLPGISGVEVFERICRVAPRCEPVFVSGYGEEVARQRGIVPGEGLFVEKPFSGEQLLLAVGLALARARSRV